MRFLADAPLSPLIVDFLIQIGHEAVHVRALHARPLWLCLDSLTSDDRKRNIAGRAGCFHVTCGMRRRVHDAPIGCRRSCPHRYNCGVDEYIWTFSRGNRRIEVRRRATEAGHLLVVTGGDSPGSTAFRDMAALVAHQTRFEGFLIKDGWSFIGFEPERRTQADRRRTPRPAPDRRRWWSDVEFRRREE